MSATDREDWMFDHRPSKLIVRCKVCGWLLSDVAAHVAATYEDHTSDRPASSWTDRHGDVWRLGDDGLLHTPETAPFSREHVERKWGPLVPNRENGSTR